MKDEIIGKTLVFTDHHFGLKSNSPSRHKIGVKAIKNILNAIEKQSISNVIFCGDYFHQRNALTIDTLNIAHRCLQALAKKCKIYMILGNHDLFNKNSTEINSINIFKDIENLVVVDRPIEMLMNSKNVLLVPWLSDLSDFKKNSYDFLFGHFDVSAKFLIASYAKEHSKKISSSEKDISALEIDEQNDKHAVEELGNFIDLAKKNGTVFSGHIHQHKEMVVKGRKFIFVGSPYQQNLGDIGCKCGFYVIEKDGRYSFNEMSDLPKHVQFKSSKILSIGIDKYDFSCAKGNIVQKVYDTDISMEDDLNINQKIASFNPYEELLPDYQVTLDFAKDEDIEHQDNLVKMLKKSKLDYIERYIDQLDTKALEDASIEKSKLFSVMKKYYGLVNEE